MEKKMCNSINVFDIRFHNLTLEELIHKLDNMLQTQNDHIVKLAFSNPEFIIAAAQDEQLYNYLNNVDFNLADGIGVVKASSLFGCTLKERVTGTDFLPRLVKLSSDQNYSLYFLGGKPGIAEKAKENLLKREPTANIIGVHHGYFDKDDDVINDINRLKPDILMVCFGNPIQEKWIEKNLDKLDVKIIFGNGGALDFWSGNAKRAPKWMIENHIEWLFRLTQDFSLKRIKRQLKLSYFIYMYITYYLKTKLFSTHN